MKSAPLSLKFNLSKNNTYRIYNGSPTLSHLFDSRASLSSLYNPNLLQTYPVYPSVHQTFLQILWNSLPHAKRITQFKVNIGTDDEIIH